MNVNWQRSTGLVVLLLSLCIAAWVPDALASRISTGIIASVAASTSGSSGVRTRPDASWLDTGTSSLPTSAALR
jgi:hypothetical protein